MSEKIRFICNKLPAMPKDVRDQVSASAGDPAARARLDKWLWAARFFKTRGLSATALDAGRVEINDERGKRSRMVQIGDRLRIRIGPYAHLITVLGVSDKRSSAPIAQQLYLEDEEGRKARDAMAAHVRAMNASTGYESGRPTKKDRRDLGKLKGRD